MTRPNVLLVQDERTGTRELWLTVQPQADPVVVAASGARLRDLAAMLTSAAYHLAAVDCQEGIQ
jgi:hypothetical protein